MFFLFGTTKGPSFFLFTCFMFMGPSDILVNFFSQRIFLFLVCIHHNKFLLLLFLHPHFLSSIYLALSFFFLSFFLSFFLLCFLFSCFVLYLLQSLWLLKNNCQQNCKRNEDISVLRVIKHLADLVL